MDALPLPAAARLDRFRQLAEELRAARDGDRVRDWAIGWPGEGHIERQVRAMAEVPRTLAGAETVLAALHGFDSWKAFARHLEDLADPSSLTARFEAAADAVVGGEIDALAALLREDPSLARATSNRRSRATLLHYVAANGVEDFRQKTPGNIVAIARLLLDAGAEVDAPNADYGGGGTALGLVATSVHPEEAGVQIALLELLAAAGASLEGLPDSWRPMDAAVANGCPEAAVWLADRGARVTLIAAAALGRLDDVARAVDGAPRAELEQAFVLACGYGRTACAELLLGRAIDLAAGQARGALHLAAEWGHLEVVRLLLARGAPVDAPSRSGHTALDAAIRAALRRGDPTAYLPIIDSLIAAGARVDDGRTTGVAAIDERLRGAVSR